MIPLEMQVALRWLNRTWLMYHLQVFIPRIESEVVNKIIAMSLWWNFKLLHTEFTRLPWWLPVQCLYNSICFLGGEGNGGKIPLPESILCLLKLILPLLKIVPPVAKKYYVHMANTMVKNLKQYSLHDQELGKV